MLENLEQWEDRLLEIEADAVPASGNKVRALSLARDMETTRLHLVRLVSAR